MKKPLSGALSKRYLAALHLLFEQSPVRDLRAAHKLGTWALTLGLETRDLASIHDHALVTLIRPERPSEVRYDMATRASIFFTEAIAPIEEMNRRARKVGVDLDKKKTALERHALALADSNRDLEREIARRDDAEEAVHSGGGRFSRVLGESRLLQTQLQEMVRRILNAHEEERRATSSKLRDEIAQTLVGIQIRLLALKKEVSDGDEDFEKEIAIAQRLVNKSIEAIERFASESGISHAK